MMTEEKVTIQVENLPALFAHAMAKIVKHEAELTRLQSLIAEKDEALEPFAKRVADYDVLGQPAYEFGDNEIAMGTRFKVGDLRRAAKAKELK